MYSLRGTLELPGALSAEGRRLRLMVPLNSASIFRLATRSASPWLRRFDVKYPLQIDYGVYERGPARPADYFWPPRTRLGYNLLGTNINYVVGAKEEEPPINSNRTGGRLIVCYQ
ncbi:hypothetical protein EVAR_71603_1 [Eumeta japonica]|uniref:Uncharacterized protein n=1 Tax=Eumeta variegata TaxID=151549 RepID=A0A4C1TC17_EUMVA|nr:hypothetical protein EVAR_71603_1 [Eumeta japonica]